MDSNDLEKVLRRQESFHTIIESISSELELRPLLTRIVQHACELLDADRGTIGLVDEERDLIRTEAVYQMPADEWGAEMPPGVGLAGRVLETRAPIVVQQYGELERPMHAELITDAVIGLPIFWHGQMIGFFGIGAARPRQFTDHDVEILAQFARHAAIAIVNARLFAAEKRQAARHLAVSHIGKLLAGTLDIDELLQTAVTAIEEHLAYENTAVFLLDANTPDILTLSACSGVYTLSVGYSQPVSQGVVGLAAQTRQPLLVADVSREPRYLPLPGAPDIRSELALPLIAHNRLLGVLNVESEEPLTAEDVPDLEIVADQLAMAIANAHLFNQMQHTLAETQLLYEASQRIGAVMDVDDVIQAYLEHVAARGRYVCNVVLYEFDEEGQRRSVVVCGRWTAVDGLQLLHERLPYTQDALDPLLDTGQTVTIANVFTDPRVSEELRQIQQRSGRPALAMIPLMVHHQRIGLVILSYATVYQWAAADLWPYQVTATQLATVIHTRRQQFLLHKSDREVAVLRERQRLARELHDSVTQLIFSITLIAQSIAPAWTRSRVEGEQRVNRLLELSKSALAEMRALLFELRSEEPIFSPAETDSHVAGITRLKRDGLKAALKRYMASGAHEGLRFQLKVPDDCALPLDQEIALYRIAQEALNNAAKHAQAQQVRVELRINQDGIWLLITDDGVGFVLAPGGDGRQAQTGFGLSNMRERAEALGGHLQISSRPGQGTTVQVQLPPNNEGL
jgi:signal transduction histidine kinase/putative methionine-R-sulfoxide reductase with GAF domain